MKLWLLKANGNVSSDDNPWEPWYDKAVGFVVRAETENEARCRADSCAGDENEWTFDDGEIRTTTHPWLDPKYSTCEELLSDGEPQMVIRDFMAA